ncbi:hypothetical protein UAW_03034 [Enterococcus haemoperoxidus ATCC BAA-382]|uniref:Uncharacterized protein n=1 Tax=Enterococcus haemoperoxidus ATCC BAA-382 TaxID=1158608 RepID=R2SWD4_9ENTE|nr:hypothetical protein UAW_03034 [Enterococcus haemoperoxidus ATCC BAA-382]EOT61735.1 hypothetical protein I583_00717 [Enterococcus haemoperoxidus ATCC BAA-382]
MRILSVWDMTREVMTQTLFSLRREESEINGMGCEKI